MGKSELLALGILNMERFCAANALEVPTVNVRTRADWMVGACAYYRPVYIEICPDACAHIGTAGRSWSYPGYSVDRTPYGVIAHELGHHADRSKSARRGAYFGDYSIKLRAATGETPLTSYCPNDAEWFAEMFRLFVTNPDLLRLIKPETHKRLASEFAPSVTDTWESVLKNAPVRTIEAAKKKVAANRSKP